MLRRFTFAAAWRWGIRRGAWNNRNNNIDDDDDDDDVKRSVERKGKEDFEGYEMKWLVDELKK
jgi:hypothetical protein